MLLPMTVPFTLANSGSLDNLGHHAIGGSLVWKANAGTGDIPTTIVWSSPAEAPDLGHVFIGSRNGHLYAFHAATGKAQFSEPTGGYIDSSPTVRNGTVFVGCSENWSVGAFSARNGKRLWSTNLDGLVDSSPVVSPDGKSIACGDDGGQTHLLDAATGDIRWSSVVASGDPPAYSSPAFSPCGNTVFAANGGLSGNGSVRAFAAANGSRIWTYKVAGSVQSSPALAPRTNAVVFGSWDSHVYAVKSDTGALLWRTATGGKVDTSAHFSPDGSTVYMGSWDFCLYAINVQTGAHRWRSCTGGVVRSSATPSADGQSVLVGSADGYLYCFNAVDGRTKWRAYCGHSDPAYGVRSTPLLSLDQAKVYVGSSDGNLYAFTTGFAR